MIAAWLALAVFAAAPVSVVATDPDGVERLRETVEVPSEHEVEGPRRQVLLLTLTPSTDEAPAVAADLRIGRRTRASRAVLLAPDRPVELVVGRGRRAWRLELVFRPEDQGEPKESAVQPP